VSYRDILNTLDLSKMNLKRIDSCIIVMRRVVDLDLSFSLVMWQAPLGPKRYSVKTENSLHQCGMSACFGGHLALSPEFKEIGGRVGDCGEPRFHGHSGANAVQEFLGLPSVSGITQDLGSLLCYSNHGLYLDENSITAQAVLTRLEYARTVSVTQKRFGYHHD